MFFFKVSYGLKFQGKFNIHNDDYVIKYDIRIMMSASVNLAEMAEMLFTEGFVRAVLLVSKTQRHLIGPRGKRRTTVERREKKG